MWNNHRVYGKYRVPMMAANYEFIEVIDSHSPPYKGRTKPGTYQLPAGPDATGTFFVMRKPHAT